MSMKQIGVLVGETKPLSAVMVSKTGVSVGQYLLVESRDAGYLALVQSVWRANPFLQEELTDPEHALRIMELEKWDSYYRVQLAIVGQLGESGITMPKRPPLPGAKVVQVDPEKLKGIIGAKDTRRWARFGTLLGSDVPVFVDVDQLVLRHLAVLAVTGGGKSNTIAVILQAVKERRGTVVVLDPHGEYASVAENPVNPVINPLQLSPDELGGFLGVDMKSSIQFYLMSKARQRILDDLRASNISPDQAQGLDQALRQDMDYFQELQDQLLAISEQGDDVLQGIKRDSLAGLFIRIENLRSNMSDLFNPGARPLVEKIAEHKINAVDLSGLDQRAADTVAAHLLRHILQQRKNALAGRDSCLKAPVFIVVEEAHLFCPDAQHTRTKHIASRIAREGRKFGVGLAVVSQRPKRLDPDVLSQMNNMVVLRIVEPGDQQHIARASENLSGELVNYLASLNPGEAVCTGPAFKVPLLVKVDRAKAKLAGKDIAITQEWARSHDITPEEAEGLY